MPDPDRPSSAPLTEADADRLSERFTASWDEPEPVATPVAAPPTPAPAPVAPPATIAAQAAPVIKSPPAAFGQTVPLPAVQPKAPTAPVAAAPIAARPPVAAAASAATPRAKSRQTLLGIAPIVVVGPSQPPAAMPTAAKPAAGTTPPIPAAPAISTEATSSPTATAVTTPSKPYVPKDHPLTPAVVISGDVISAEAPTGGVRPRDEDRARIAQTIPGQARSNPLAAPAPVAAVIAAAKPAPSTLDDTYPPIKQRGSKLPAVIAGLALLAAAAIAIAKLSAGTSGGSPETTIPRAS